MEARFPRWFPLPSLDGAWLRLVLTAMVLVASASLLTGPAASLNSITFNPGTSFEAGDLILSDRDRLPTPCESRGLTVKCEDLFPAAAEPGVLDPTTVTLTNLGTLPVGKLVVSSNTCTGALCSHTWFSIHDDDHNFCYFPVQAAGACPADVHLSYNDFAAKFPASSPLELNPDHIGGGNAYTLVAEIDPALGNDFQARKADMTFTWEIIQA